MAPEVLKSERYDLKADAYSFGLVLYEMIVGPNPLRAKGFHSFVLFVCH